MSSSSRPKRARKAPERYGTLVTVNDADIIEILEEDTPPRASKRARTTANKENNASRAVVPPVPKPAAGQWESAVDPSTNRTYYFNRTTGQREWTLPEGAVLKSGHTAAPASVSCAPAASVPSVAPRAAATRTARTRRATSPPRSLRKPNDFQQICLTKAMQKYRLTDAEVKTLVCEFEENPVNPAYAPMRLYDEIEVWEVAMIKWGSGKEKAAARAARRQRAAEAAAIQQRNRRTDEEVIAELKAENARWRASQEEYHRKVKERREHVGSLMETLGLPSDIIPGKHRDIYNYIHHGHNIDCIEAALDSLKSDYDRQQAAEKNRREALVAALSACDLPLSAANDASFSDYIKKGDVGDAEKVATAYKEAREQSQREAAVRAACKAAGLPDGSKDNEYFGSYMRTGEGLETAVAKYGEGLRAARVAEAKRRQEEASKKNEAVRQKWLAGRPPVGWTPEFHKGPSIEPICVYTGCRNNASICSYGLCCIHKDYCRDLNCRKHGGPARLQPWHLNQFPAYPMYWQPGFTGTSHYGGYFTMGSVN